MDLARGHPFNPNYVMDLARGHPFNPNYVMDLARLLGFYYVLELAFTTLYARLR